MKSFCIGLLLLTSTVSFAQYYDKIDIKGADNLGAQAVRHYSNLNIKNNISRTDIRMSITRLYESGLFSDVQIFSSGKTLYVVVVENPVVAKINFQGTDHMPREQFIKALDAQGIAVGKVFNPRLVFQIKPMLKETLASMGYENASVAVHTKRQNKSIVLDIVVDEGSAKLIKDIEFYGVHAVPERVLLGVMDSAPRLWSFVTENNKFSNFAMQRDLRAIEKYYQSKGYVKARAVLLKTIAVDGGVSLKIQVTEGKKYFISGASLVGFAKHDYSSTLKSLAKDEPYNVDMVEMVRVELEHDLGSLGYAFAKVSFTPKLLPGNRVSIVYNAVLGEKIKVRRINFTGQVYTQDEVLRREMRQIEASQYNYSLIRESERNLRTLDFIKSVQCKPSRHNEFVDLDCEVSEMASSNFIASVGYSPQSGITYKADIDQKNLAGSGKKLLVSLEKSDVQTSGQISMTQPYIFGTDYSNTWSFDAVKMKNINKNAAKYQTNHVGLSNDFSVPIMGHDFFSLGLGLQNIKIVSYDKSVDYIDQFVKAHGERFSVLDLHFSLLHRSYDRTPFPTSGSSRRLMFTTTLPYKDATLRYYKVDFNNSSYWNLSRGFTLNWLLQLGYGKGFGGDSYPFFKNYWAGGEGSVRGFETNSLGPVDKNGNAKGANVLAASSLNLYLPQMLGDDIRYGLFLDVGNVFNDSFNAHDLRASSGLVLQWRTPLAPMAFSFGFPIVKKTGDKLQSFAVSLATDF